MMTILTLIGKDLRLFWNDKVAVVVSFLVPMVLMTIFGMVFGGFGDGGGSGVNVMVVDQAGTDASRTLVAALQKEEGLNVVVDYRASGPGEGEFQRLPLTEEIARERLATEANSWRFLIIFPEDFQKPNFGFRLRYLYNPRSEVEYQIVTGLMQRSFFANAFPLLERQLTKAVSEQLGADEISEYQDEISRVVSASFGMDYDEVRATFPEGALFPSQSAMMGGSSAETAAGEGETAANDPFSLLLELDDEQIAGKGKPPAAQTVGGWAVMFLLFTMTGAASALFEERDQGVFHRLLSGPVSRSQILWSKYCFLTVLGLFQLVVLMSFGQAVFRVITSVDQLLPLAAICLAGAAASTGFGMILCSLCKTPAQANGLGTLFILSMSALGGAMFPSFMFPEFVREFISPFSMVHWMMEGVLMVLWEDAQIRDLWLHLGVLLGIAAATLSLALWRFRVGDLFR